MYIYIYISIVAQKGGLSYLPLSVSLPEIPMLTVSVSMILSWWIIAPNSRELCSVQCTVFLLLDKSNCLPGLLNKPRWTNQIYSVSQLQAVSLGACGPMKGC